MNGNAVQSHIQMPRCVLRRFENEFNSFFYYDVSKGVIGNNGHAKSINTQFGYYSEEVEQFLRDNVETPFSKVLEYVDKINFSGEVFTVSNGFAETAKIYAYSLLARDPKLLAEINKNSVFYQFFPAQGQRDYAVTAGINLSKENGFFKDYAVTFTVNKTAKPFVLPVCGLYSYKLHNVIHVNLPISPQITLTFVESSGKRNLMHEDVVSMYLLSDEVVLDRFNRYAFQFQCRNGWGYIVSPEKKILEDLHMAQTHR